MKDAIPSVPVYALVETVLAAAERPLTTEEIASHLSDKAAFKSIQNSLSKLQHWGRVEQISGQGLSIGTAWTGGRPGSRYMLTEAGRELLEQRQSEQATQQASQREVCPRIVPQQSKQEVVPPSSEGWWRVMGRLFSDPQDAIERAEERWEAGQSNFTVEWSMDGREWVVVFAYKSFGAEEGGFGGEDALEGLEGWEGMWRETRTMRKAVAA